MHFWHLMMVMGEATAEDAKAGRGTGGKKEGVRKGNIPVGDTSDGALLELHHVASQGPRLVRENVFHLYG